MNHWWRNLSAGLLILWLGILLPLLVPSARATTTDVPVANYFLSWELTDYQAQELAKFDVVILDMEIQAKRPDLLRKMRELNPRIILLAYITSQEIRQDAPGGYSVMRRRLAAGMSDQWYLKNSQGNKITWWPGTWLLNVSPNCPTYNGERFSDYLVRFVNTELLSSGLWNGVFYDNTWDNITHFAGSDVDLNADRVTDSNPNPDWQAGMKQIYQKTRAAHPGAIVVGNGTTRYYQTDLNGKMLENFLPVSWGSTMETLKANVQNGQTPAVNIINANTANTGNQNYQAMRFGLGSALLENSYFSYDYGDQNHGQTWWFDEYTANLGAPVTTAASRNQFNSYRPDVWRRDFEHGLVVLNSTDERATVDLGGDYEKINGQQDHRVNDGSIVSEVEINPADSLILLKTSSKINDVVFGNSNFARFYHPDGSRVRNGYFVFDDAYKGGDQIAYLDLDGDGVRDTVVASGNKITGKKSDGQPLFKFYPYTANYTGTVQFTVGDLDTDGEAEIYVAPAKGAGPIKIYNLVGEEMLAAWYPYGKNYTAGYSLGVMGTGLGGRIVVGGKNVVSVFDPALRKKAEWRAFDRYYTGAVKVATGDFDGNGLDEIAAGFGGGTYPVVKFFTGAGAKFAPDLVLKSQVFRKAEIRTGDLDFDKKDDVILLTVGAL